MLTPNQLKYKRLELGLTLEDIAKEMHATKQTISNAERGKSSQMTLAFYERVLSDFSKEKKHSFDI